MQYFTLLLLANMMVAAYALALFQLGMVLQVFAGYNVFNEKHITRKLLACLAMMAGSLPVLMATRVREFYLNKKGRSKRYV